MWTSMNGQGYAVRDPVRNIPEEIRTMNAGRAWHVKERAAVTERV
jgi:hypothetical protein